MGGFVANVSIIHFVVYDFGTNVRDESVAGCFPVEDDFVEESLPFSAPNEYFVGTESERSDLVIFMFASPSRRVIFFDVLSGNLSNLAGMY